MPFATRRTIALVATSALLAGTAAAGAAATGLLHRRESAAPVDLGANARRFLDLTGERSAASATGGRASHDGGGDKDGDSADAGDPGSATAVSGDRTPQGWLISPAGTQVDVLRFPLGITPTADGKVIVSSDGGGVQGLTTIDPATMAAVPTPAANLFMGVVALPSGDVFASGGNADRVFRFKVAGGTVVNEDATEAAAFPTHAERDTNPPFDQQLPAGDGIPVTGYPGNAVADPGKNLLYVAGTLSEDGGNPNVCPSGQTACGRVSIIDTDAGSVVSRVPAGLDVYGLALDSGRNRLYATNWADEAGRGKGAGGTVSVIDVASPTSAKELHSITVGHHPSAVQLSADATRLFVADTNDDTVSILDVTGDTPKLVAKQSVRPIADAPVGAHPDAFALSPDGRFLFVALAGLNAVEVLDGHTGRRLAGDAPRLIPTGFYPSALTVTGTADSYKLWVANAKGRGPGAGVNGSVFFDGTQTGGTVNAVDLPWKKGQLEDWTEKVKENDRLDVTVPACKPHRDVSGALIKPSPVLCPKDGKSSPIKHVVYIVTENKTFDQYFGDMDPSKGYDADNSWTLYGRTVTPNHHALADRYSLGDRFFSDAEVSVTGHSWTSGAIATDHNEKIWPTDYEDGVRGNHGGGDPHKPGAGQATGSAADNELQDPEGGYIFEAFRRAGAVPPSAAGPGKLSMAIYGERTAVESGNMDAYKAAGWKDGDISYFDTCRANEFIHGKVDGNAGSATPLTPSAPEIGSVTASDCEKRSLDANFALATWEAEYKKTGRDTMPSFIYMSLPVNHTMAANIGSPTPASMVADNDYAIGLIADALSHSDFWKSTVIMQTEDDTQVAGDHVSALRDYLAVSGPLAKPGPDHQWGSMPALLRTIETIFKVPPISLNDRLAAPMHAAFLSDPKKLNADAYTATKPAVPFALNTALTPGSAASSRMDWSTVDRIDMEDVNAILYAIGKGWPLPDRLQH